MGKVAKISCYWVSMPGMTEDDAKSCAQELLEAYRHTTGQKVTIDDEAWEETGISTERATYFTKLVCDGLVDLGELVPLGFDFEIID